MRGREIRRGALAPARTPGRPGRSRWRRLAGACLAAAALLAAALAPLAARAQQIELRAPPSVRDGAAAEAMRDLAGRLLPVYLEQRPELYLDNLSALQFVAGNEDAADATRRSLHRRLAAARTGAAAAPVPVPGSVLLLDIYVHASVIAGAERLPFDRAFARAYGEAVAALDDASAFAVNGLPPADLAPMERDLDAALARARAEGGLPMSQAVQLVHDYFAWLVRARGGAQATALGAQDDARRYLFEEAATIDTGQGVRLRATLARPRGASRPLPAVLEFAADPAAAVHAREFAAHGYAGVVAYSRALGKGVEAPDPFEVDGRDAAAVIQWITRQPWSDGRVAMDGSGHSAFAAWSAARRAPAALKALVTADPIAPGVDFPMQGGIFLNGAYRWIDSVAHARGPAQEGARAAAGGGPMDQAQWESLLREWYRDGDPCADLDALAGRPSPVLHEWLRHPDYDRYWRAMVPAEDELGRLDIPVLSITGSYSARQGAAFEYFERHAAQRPDAPHTLVIGPYEEGAAGREPPALGARGDEAAAIDLRALRFRWLDHVLRGAPEPEPLQGRVNYEVGGAGGWAHASTLQELEGNPLRLYLDPDAGNGARRLSATAGAPQAFTQLVVDLAGRGDAAEALARPEGAAQAAAGLALAYSTDPLPRPLEVGGRIRAHFEIETNKRDLDLTVWVCELLPDGRCPPLFAPAYALRASYAGDRARRRLLRAGARQVIDVRLERFAGRRLAAGSRLVAWVGVNKRPEQEIDYGSGRDVREEYLENAGVPLQVRWYSGSYLELPVRPAPLP